MNWNWIVGLIFLIVATHQGSATKISPPESISGPLKIVHFNIKELHSLKIATQGGRGRLTQLNAASEIIKSLNPDLLSLNEIQFDMPGVPDRDFQSHGDNINKLAQLFNMPYENTLFFPANTGLDSKPTSDGTYILENPTQEQRQLYADPVNFGMFPAQYSTGFISRYPILGFKEIHNLTWKSVFPNRDLSVFKDNNGNPLPEDMALFDKNFLNVVVWFQGAPLNLILLHTVPAYHFGSEHSPNYARNFDQLKFLQWYLGGRDSGIDQVEGVEPLPPGASFVAMGDWNVDEISDNPGGEVIGQLRDQFKMWMNGPVLTYLGSTFEPNGYKAQLDYILLSSDLKILSSGVYHPDPAREEAGCGKGPFPAKPGKVLVRYKSPQEQNCAAYVSDAFYSLKRASDHIPIWVEITR